MDHKKPEYIKVDQKELAVILETVKPHLTTAQYKILESAIKMLSWLLLMVKDKSFSIRRLSRMIFGKTTESFKKLKDRLKDDDSDEEPPSSDNGNSLDETTPVCDETPSGEESENTTSVNTESTAESTEKKTTSEEDPPQPNPAKKEKKKNHGRRPLNDYKGISNITHILHKDLKPGEICPECGLGYIYNYEPQLILTIHGQPALRGNIWSAQGLRCSACMKIFRADFPKEVITQPKADFAAKALVCISKYQLGTPLYRLETWQKLQHLPISDSEMWEWTESVALILQPLHQALVKIAASSNLIHNDDTTARVLDLMAENLVIKKEQAEQAKNGKKNKEQKRVGIYTTAMLAKQDDHEIAIYVTGRQNAGENLDDLLDNRSKDLKRPVQACDASSQNKPEKHETDMAKCFNHARHNFCEILECWPKECLTIIELMNAVFMNDRETKKMSPEERQKYHEKNSTPIMEKIKTYSNNLLTNKEVEPNSNLGKAIAYLNNHWEGLSFFLKNGEAPLSNNDCERTIKSFVLIRKNSYFYKSLYGAMVGDILLSTITTCRLNDVNAYDYLIALQANAKEVHKNPNAWLPWNYTQNSTSPYVNTACAPKEEIYQSAGMESLIIPLLSSDVEKKTLRERCKSFFRNIYKEPKQALSPC